MPGQRAAASEPYDARWARRKRKPTAMIPNLRSPKTGNQLRDLESLPYPDNDLARVLNGADTILMLTIPKSGTHWLRYLVTNYSRLLDEPASPPVKYKALNDYSQPRDFLIRGERTTLPTKSVFAAAGYRTFMFQHPWRRGLIDSDCWAHLGPKLCLYRNPLDFVVSSYFYYFENRDDRRAHASSPRDILEPYLEAHALLMRFFREKVLPAGRATLVSYEEMRIAPAERFTEVLAFLDVEVIPELVERAVEYSTAEVVREQEDRRGRSFVARLDRGQFVRDSSVGQWRDHLTNADVRKARKVLARSGIDLDDYILDED